MEVTYDEAVALIRRKLEAAEEVGKFLALADPDALSAFNLAEDYAGVGVHRSAAQSLATALGFSPEAP